MNQSEVFVVHDSESIAVLLSLLIHLTWAGKFMVGEGRVRIHSEIKNVDKNAKVAECKDVHKGVSVFQV